MNRTKRRMQKRNLPKVMVYSHQTDVRAKENKLNPHNALRVWQKWRSGQVCYPKLAKRLGPTGYCYHNVLDVIKQKKKGRMVLGWSVIRDTENVPIGNRNCLSQYYLIAHALWEYGRTLWDVTYLPRLDHRVSFVKDEIMTHPCSQSISLADNRIAAREFMSSRKADYRYYVVPIDRSEIEDCGVMLQSDHDYAISA